MAMNMSVHDIPGSQVHEDGGYMSYWELSEHAVIIYWHIGLALLAWAGVLPVAVMLSISHSRFALPSQFVFLAVNGLALSISHLYNKRTPNLYDNNVHGRIGWIITCTAMSWIFIALIQAYVGRSAAPGYKSVQSMITGSSTEYHQVEDGESSDALRWSDDHGQSPTLLSRSLDGYPVSSSMGSVGRHLSRLDMMQTQDAPRGSFVTRSFSRCVACFARIFSARSLRLFYVLIERTVLVQGFVAVMSGTIVYGGIGRDIGIFNVLAHYIKGSIFFFYGLLTLGRWMGAFADYGWAWNAKLKKEVHSCQTRAVPSAEFTESFVMWLYGVTNVFLEHLAAWGKAWTAQDLEHVSISILFFGGGLLGMIVESNTIREILSNSVLSSQALQDLKGISDQPHQYGFSMNPVPSLVIFLLGKMMSSHHQGSILSTAIHTQWGSMLIGFALARYLTYIIMYIVTPTSFLPSRPPTEVIASFCLIAGGLSFIISNRDTVTALESYDLDAMFTFTIITGITALIMAWTVITFMIKSWALQKERISRYGESHASPLD
ncbi:uncharacterized protein M421DRAFT_415464 [Didymella exigua CBS 183.55]|uniref:Integral membrane protein n=1 Tax=Didymella exigua CBS 183.55 TaxID=1150837 RepID=A0A6A5S139_9PLEO|nr:uncharacterized protein M421DRAFT_415464 [Didymella exigua CBS 183.55]KAF1934435.1 integral membrane protein [Didymella exigua CBS 183.55]